MSETLGIEEFRNQAQLALAQIETAFANGNLGSEIVALDQSRTGRLARMDAMQQQAMGSALKERLAWEKRRLQAALERMQYGRFGICCYCEDMIPVERLRADVAAPFCVSCQDGIDARNTTIL